MKQSLDVERMGPDGQTANPAFDNPLPGGEGVWKDSALGLAAGWPDAVQALSLILASLAYPAAVLWGEELVLLYNEEWTNVGGVDQQGQRQKGKLSADAYGALSSALHGGQPRHIPSHALLRGENQNEAEKYTVLISPLFDDQSNAEGASGLFAQLLPQKDGQSQTQKLKRRKEEISEQKSQSDDGSPRRDGFAPRRKGPVLDTSKLGTVADNTPLDEHPFFRRFADLLPSGLAILDHKAQAVFVNQHFYELTTHETEDKSFKGWPQSIHPDDYDRVMQAYKTAFDSQQQLRTEFRALGKAQPWRLLLLTPLGDENLQHVSLLEYGGFICSIVDISSEKCAELYEREAAKKARERKEQQERFIDMISHEIRNPLSAVLHCSEDIEEAVADKSNVNFAAINEATETINLCISHQRNIVNDVLSFSKLDASMLSLSPKSSEPGRQLANTLKMFQPEFRKQHMEMIYRLDKSYQNYNIAWVQADLARVGQVLVNLVSNSIKFTARSEGEKNIVVSVGASKDRPTSFPPSVVFFDPDDTSARMDTTDSADWGNGEAIYIMVAVRDTGIGISDEGQKRLFERFRQATPETEEIYGGSGLGLNISRKLCHLHGGDIGVTSQEGKGSTFGFFFKARRTEPPEDYEGRADEDSMADETLRSQVKQLGNTAPDDLKESDMPETLRNPPVEHTEEVSPHPSGHKDASYQHTEKVANEVQSSNGSNPVHNAADDMQPESKSAPSPDTTTVNKTPSKGKGAASNGVHILLVEDNIINQRIVVRKLEAKGFTVTTANNGREAVDAVRGAPKRSSGEKGTFHVVLMDQEMPVMDGNTATKEIRELQRKGEVERTPILGVTANVRGAQQDERMQSGMVSTTDAQVPGSTAEHADLGQDDIIEKPYKIEELVRKINGVLKLDQ
ncbi:hypothetical protein LTR08_008942 [Meristemomyces frigidus]|nr:hypothetical protein LTR08_008942 [Meristemomyces frigidus]